MILTVYTSGSIKKSTEDTKRLVWSDRERNAVSEGAKPHDVRFFNPDDPVPNLGDVLSMFGRDMYQVKHADFVIVDARERRGIGIGVEILASRILKTPLIVVAPPNSHYRKDYVFYRGAEVTDYIHPHLAVLADVVVDDFQRAGKWMAAHKLPSHSIKGSEALQTAIKAYEDMVLDQDACMQSILRELRGPGQEG